MRVLDMGPACSINDTMDGSPGHAVLPGQASQGWHISLLALPGVADGLSLLSYLQHLLFGQLDSRMPLTTSLPAAGITVGHVLLVGADGQVGRLVAVADVTGVVYLESLGYGPDECRIRQDMDSFGLASVVQHPVAVLVPAAVPEQAFAVSGAPAQQTLTQRQDGILIRHHDPSQGSRGVSPLPVSAAQGTLLSNNSTRSVGASRGEDV